MSRKIPISFVVLFVFTSCSYERDNVVETIYNKYEVVQEVEFFNRAFENIIISTVVWSEKGLGNGRIIFSDIDFFPPSVSNYELHKERCRQLYLAREAVEEDSTLYSLKCSKEKKWIKYWKDLECK